MPEADLFLFAFVDGNQKTKREKKKEISLSPMTKALHRQKNPKSNVTTQKRH